MTQPWDNGWKNAGILITEEKEAVAGNSKFFFNPGQCVMSASFSFYWKSFHAALLPATWTACLLSWKLIDVKQNGSCSFLEDIKDSKNISNPNKSIYILQ